MSAPEKSVVKLTVNLSEEVYNTLKDLATQQSTTVTEALRKAISTENFIRKAETDNAKILIEDKDKNLKQVVFR